jgi:hypothetical protein
MIAVVVVVVALMNPICARTAFNIIMSFMHVLHEFYERKNLACHRPMKRGYIYTADKTLN